MKAPRRFAPDGAREARELDDARAVRDARHMAARLETCMPGVRGLAECGCLGAACGRCDLYYRYHSALAVIEAGRRLPQEIL